MNHNYFYKYLQVAPFSLALWRTLEAKAIAAVPEKYHLSLKEPMLDIGCGFGEFAGVYFDRYIEVGIDKSAEDLFLAAQQKKYHNLVLADARQMPFKNRQFSSIISVSSLEHIKNVEQVLQEAYRILKPKGVFVFTVPTQVYNDYLFFPIFKSTSLKLYHKIFKHELLMSTADWVNLAKAAGFKVLGTEGILSKRQVRLFQLGLITALPSQIARWLTKKRRINPHNSRPKYLFNLLHRFANIEGGEANVIVICQKP